MTLNQPQPFPMNTFIIAAITLDGKIAKYTEHNSYSWTCAKDKKFFVKKTKEAGVVIVGRKTWEIISKPLEGRLLVVICKEPKKYAKEFVRSLGAKQAGEVEFTSLPPKQILQDLEARGYQSAAVAGGAEIYSLFLREKLIDELYLTVHPLIFGQGIDFVSDIGVQDFEISSVKKFGSKCCLLHVRCPV